MSEDYIYDTLEFNEFLQMMSKQQENEHTRQISSRFFFNVLYFKLQSSRKGMTIFPKHGVDIQLTMLLIG